MATVFSGYNSKGWKPSGSSYYKHYRSRVDYWVNSESATQLVVGAYTSVNIDTSVNASYGAQQSATNYGAVSGSGKTVFEKGNTVALIGTQYYTYNKTHSAYTVGVTGYVWSSTGDWNGQWVGVTGYVTVPAKTNYAVSYNANGGTGSIANSTKWYGENLTLSDGSGMTWAHHTLIGWNTKADGTGTHYDLGGTYTGNAGMTLYAEWKLNAIESKTKVDGAWKNGIFYYKVNGTWVLPYAGYIKVNGIWRQIIRKETQ